MAGETPKVVPFGASKESALVEIHRQLEQGYSLVAGARAMLAQDNPRDADNLLDMAEDILAEREYINRVHPQKEESDD